MTETLVHSLAHRARGSAVVARVARDEVGRHLIIPPAADAGAFVRRDVEGMPAGGFGAGEFLPVIERKSQIARRVAFAAMRQRFGEISAAIPLRALRGVGREPRMVAESP